MQNSATHTQQWISWGGSGIRSRLRRRGPFGGFFLQIVPWFDMAVVAALLIAVSPQYVRDRGVSFDLPSAPFSEGVQSGAGLVVFRTNGPDAETLAFFDDVRYKVGTEDEKLLAAEIARYARRLGGGQILLLADAQLSHGDVMRIVNLVRGAGVKSVNVAVKPQ